MVYSCKDANKIKDLLPPTIGTVGIAYALYGFFTSVIPEDQKNAELIYKLSSTALFTFLVDTMLKANVSIECKYTL